MDNINRVKISNNLRPMFVKEIFFEHTDENHFLTVNEILELLRSQFGLTTTRKTLYEDIDQLIRAGIDIECVKGRQNQYHMLSRDFDLAELRILIDFVESQRSIPLARSKELVAKLSRLAGPSADILLRDDNSVLHPRSENTQFYYIIDAIYSAIGARKQIAFKYYEYLTSARKSLKNNGNAYRVSPYRLVSTFDYYYLVGYSEKHKKIATFRADRISGIPQITETDSIPEPEDLNVDKYIKESYHMKDGDLTEVILEFDSDVIDAMTDRFGPDIDITYVERRKCRTQVAAQTNNIFFAWIFGFEGKVRIAGPQEVSERYISMLSREIERA